MSDRESKRVRIECFEAEDARRIVAEYAGRPMCSVSRSDLEAVLEGLDTDSGEDLSEAIEEIINMIGPQNNDAVDGVAAEDLVNAIGEIYEKAKARGLRGLRGLRAPNGRLGEPDGLARVIDAREWSIDTRNRKFGPYDPWAEDR